MPRRPRSLHRLEELVAQLFRAPDVSRVMLVFLFDYAEGQDQPPAGRVETVQTKLERLERENALRVLDGLEHLPVEKPTVRRVGEDVDGRQHSSLLPEPLAVLLAELRKERFGRHLACG